MTVIIVVRLVLRHSFVFFFFKQKTAYEMRISDWSSDVCSSDLPPRPGRLRGLDVQGRDGGCCIPGAPRDGDEAGRPAGGEQAGEAKIGRASCRERVGQYV